jgi:RNA polymerase sigma factor (sigma-70 family)
MDDRSRPEAERLFLDQLETIERAIRFACRNRSLPNDDTEDFASYVKLKLLEDDYAIIRKHDRNSSFPAFISVVIQRLLLDYRIAQWGKWHASAVAKRLGEPALTIETMLYRDNRSIEEIVPLVLRRWPDLTRHGIERLAALLPDRTPRPRMVGQELAASAAEFAEHDIHELAFEEERLAMSRRIATVVRGTLKGIEDGDRLICRLRFEGGMSVADIARLLRVEQKPLYKRVQRVLTLLRRNLEKDGIKAEDVHDVLSSRSTDLDFGFAPLAFVRDLVASGEGEGC